MIKRLAGSVEERSKRTERGKKSWGEVLDRRENKNIGVRGEGGEGGRG